MPINSRKKGIGYELQVINKLKELGFPDAVSSRSESKRWDDKGVDVLNVPLVHIQCKAVERGLDLHKTLTEMPTDKVPVVFWKRNRKGSIVSMKEEDFYNILCSLTGKT